jgi:hypothetical protein
MHLRIQSIACRKPTSWCDRRSRMTESLSSRDNDTNEGSEKEYCASRDCRQSRSRLTETRICQMVSEITTKPNKRCAPASITERLNFRKHSIKPHTSAIRVGWAKKISTSETNSYASRNCERTGYATSATTRFWNPRGGSSSLSRGVLPPHGH